MRRYRCTSVVIVACLFSTSAIPLDGDDAANDSTKTVLESYLRAVDARRTRSPLNADELAQWRQSWRKRLTAAALQNRKDEYTAVLLTKALGLANSGGEFDASEKLVGELMKLKDDTDALFRWETELGEIKQQRYLLSRIDDYRTQAIEHFKRANHAIDELLAAEDDDQTLDDLTEQLILNLAWMGELRMRGTKTECSDAIELFSRARERLESHKSPFTGRLMGLDYDREYFLYSEAMSAAKLGDVERGLQVLNCLQGNAEMRWPASFYVRRFAKEAFPERGDGYQAFLVEWLKGHELDERTPFLMFDLAHAYFRAEQYQLAETLYEQLIEKHLGVLVTEDERALAARKGGYYAEALFNLARCHLSRDDRGRAEELLERFMELYSNDARFELAKQMVARLRRVREFAGKATADGRSSTAGNVGARRILVIANAVFILALIACVGIRKLLCRKGK